MVHKISKSKKMIGASKNIVLLTDGFQVFEANRPFFRFFGVESLGDFHRRYGSFAACVEKVEAYGYLYPGENDRSWLSFGSDGTDRIRRLKLKSDAESRIFTVEISDTGEEGGERRILYLTDITDIEEYKFRLHSTNHRLQEYLKSLDAADIVSRTTPTGIITYVNEKFLEVSGYSREELVGKNHRVIRHPDMPASLFDELWETILSGNIWQGQITNRRKDGSRYVVDATIGPILDMQGEIIEFIGIRHDVTELVEARERAEKAEAAKSLFFANLSHEIRTPLNAILGFTSLLRKREDLPDDVKRMIGIIDDSGESLLQIVNDILDLSKFEQGHLDLDLSPISLEKLLRKTAALFEAQAKEKGVLLRLELSRKLSGRVLGDRHRLRQVLNNLISNAIKFTEEGGEVVIRAEVTKQVEWKQRVRIEVSDSGIGISPEVQKRIFKPFEQAEKSIEHRYGGTGLGLPISARIISAMGGELKVESREGEGSRFFFEIDFPLAGSEDGPSPCEEEERENATKAYFYGDVLLAEDQPFNRELLRTFLHRFGLEEIEMVDNGIAALERMRQHRYDLVFLDIEMPEMRGDEVLKKWRIEESGVRKRQHIIAMTAHADEESLKYFLEIGFDEVMVKPFSESSLRRILNRFMRVQKFEGTLLEKKW